MTAQDVIERISQLMGPNHLDYINAKHYLVFDKFTPDCQVLPMFRLKQLLTKNPDDSFTRLDVKILADLNNIADNFGEEIEILDTYRYVHMNRSKDDREAYAHTEGNAIDFRPKISKFMRELQKSTRRKKLKGGRLLFKDHIHIDSMSYRFWREE